MIQSYNQISGELTGIQRNREDFTLANRGVKVMQEECEDEEKVIEYHRPRSMYGNMKIICSSWRLITLGPDYICFIPTFLAFCCVSFLLMKLVHQTSQSDLFKIITDIVCIGQCLSYLLVALSNPGIITSPADNVPEYERKKCKHCQMYVPRHARHCNDCDVCIAHYDHHCPWTSKCIGGNNLVRFYIFLAWTPIYLIYITIAFVVCMSSNLIRIQQLPKAH